MQKPFIRDLSRGELVEYILSKGIEKYRSNQLFTELYKSKRSAFDEFVSLPSGLRMELMNDFELNSLKIVKKSKSIDGSIKYLFELNDKKYIEAVYMPWYDDDNLELERITLCISSMAGCPVECAFCATGTLGFQRNLTPSEIIEQIILVERDLATKVTNIVFMGMGEPLLNFNNVRKTLDILTDDNADFFGRRRITLSTAGITSKIRQLAELRNAPKLALSLHATTNGFRNKIIPLSKQTTLQKTLEAIEYYYQQTGMPITYEYIPFDGLNDTKEDAKRLAKILKRVPSRVNIIPFNDISFTNPLGYGKELKPTPKDKILEFGDLVRQFGGKVTIRDTFGADIEAACGQLALSKL